MNYGELFDYTVTKVLRDRANGSPFVQTGEKFSNSEVTLLLNEAQDIFAEESGCIRDSITDGIAKIELNDTTDLYELHPSIIQPVEDGIYLFRANYPEAGVTSYLRPLRKGSLPITHMRDPAATGCPKYYTLADYRGLDSVVSPTEEVRQRSIKLDVIPDNNDYFLTLVVIRLSLVRFEEVLSTDDQPTQDEKTNRRSEIPALYHPALAQWVKYRILSDRDVDKYSESESEIAYRAFYRDVIRAKANVTNSVAVAGLGWGNPWVTQ